ncbi:methylaspartate mutase [Streptomyces sp. NPDC127098]|uniref:methylaspartate mutase n=1 Tax=Streptomyces sp. NPDC127098 TaxID=3347137 RepID=UPI00365E4554
MNLGEFVRECHRRGTLVVQPRMGYADPARMRAGLLATRGADATTVGTITVDSYTRTGDLESAGRALREGTGLNGYPLVTHEPSTTRRVLAGLPPEEFPVQVRHGSGRPQAIVRALTAALLHATEGGPVSYCLPYGRTPLAESVRNWAHACELLLKGCDFGVEAHLETFGGCMMGQLCPPSQLVALSVLEALFFEQHGLRSISLSYAQGTSQEQDREAVAALRALSAELLSPAVDWHVVVYTYMGLYPRTAQGAFALLARAARLAVDTGSERLIVKTAAEAHRIPTIVENVAALEHAAATAEAVPRPAVPPAGTDSQTHREARALIDAVLDCHPDIGRALVEAFRRGILDIPYCVHPDNAGRSRGYIDAEGRLGWADIGSLPLAGVTETRRARPVGSAELMRALSHVQHTYDAEALEHRASRPVDARRRTVPEEEPL